MEDGQRTDVGNESCCCFFLFQLCVQSVCFVSPKRSLSVAAAFFRSNPSLQMNDVKSSRYQPTHARAWRGRETRPNYTT